MSYHTLQYCAIFLPIIMLLYQLCHEKYRWIVLLAASYVFFYMFSGFLLIYQLISVAITYITSLYIYKIKQEKKTSSIDKKKNKKRRKLVLIAGICLNLAILIVLKYTNFLGASISGLLNHMHIMNGSYHSISILVPIGISYYTFQAISYIVDVYRGTCEFEKNIGKVALYLCFFPYIVEGPITRFSQVSKEMFSGIGIQYANLTSGYQRILWGVFKKVVLADHMVIGVNKIFDSGVAYDGVVYLYGAILCTLQLYMDFAGTIDIIIGTGKIFGITLPENFRQPFFAKNAGDFWRRWHITLGTWFKDYIFYPVSFAKPMNRITKKVKNIFGISVSKMFTPTIALFCVWISNGLWHGPKITYIFYGMYYFVLIFIENCCEKPLEKLFEKFKISENSVIIRTIRLVKLFFIVIIGEMFFRADTLKLGLTMFTKIFTDFHIKAIIPVLSEFVLEPYDYLIIFFGMLAVLIVDVLNERKITVRDQIALLPKYVRWTVWYAAIFIVIIFGAYGPGFDVVAMMYAAF